MELSSSLVLVLVLETRTKACRRLRRFFGGLGVSARSGSISRQNAKITKVGPLLIDPRQSNARY